MALGMLLGEYLSWHYSLGVVEFTRAWGNIHWFLFHYFSIPTLLASLFAPFHRIQERRTRGFDPQNWFEVFIINTLMRLVGAIVRLIVIAVGVFAQAVAVCIGGASFLLYVAAPITIPASFFIGLWLIVS
ncbi:MAG: hypothetical protein AAB482_00605 [Patescibacteria group bacterium]